MQWLKQSATSRLPFGHVTTSCHATDAHTIQCNATRKEGILYPRANLNTCAVFVPPSGNSTNQITSASPLHHVRVAHAHLGSVEARCLPLPIREAHGPRTVNRLTQLSACVHMCMYENTCMLVESIVQVMHATIKAHHMSDNMKILRISNNYAWPNMHKQHEASYVCFRIHIV